MVQITDRKSAGGGSSSCQQRKPEKIRSSCFLGCFGGGNKRSPEKGENVGVKKTPSSVWFSWSKFKKISFPRKTVPLDGGCADDKVHSRKGSIFHMKSGKKLHKDQIPGSDIQKIVHDQHNQIKCDNVQEIVLENSESMNDLDSSKKPTGKKVSSRINKCTSQKSSSSSGNLTSPEDKFEVSRGTVAQLSQSVSMPPPRRKKTVSNIISSGGDSEVNIIKEKTSQRKTDGRRFDQFAGTITMIMVTLTLIVMVFFGKILAILCTCAWFYFYPVVVVRGKNEPKVGQEIGPKPGDEIDFNSPEYKKKVVLEGFLKRNHRIQ